jgi:hypothetical protein
VRGTEEKGKDFNKFEFSGTTGCFHSSETPSSAGEAFVIFRIGPFFFACDQVKVEDGNPKYRGVTWRPRVTRGSAEDEA